MSRRSAYLDAVAWVALGVVVVVASWRLDRLENLGINPYSAPGLTPGVVGLLMILLAIALAWQARGSPPPDDAARSPLSPDGADGPGGGWRRTFIAVTICVLFAGLSLGRGLPFVAEGAVFVFLFTSVFSWSQWRAEGRIRRGLSTAAAIAVAASLVISWLFESVFLVRLP